jgi:hypothetical protein
MSRVRVLMCVACLLGAGCFQDSTQQHSTFLPLNYKSTWQNVRACRLVIQHANQYQLVFANSIAVDPYTAGASPLPAGSVVVAEQHGNDASCNNLLGYYLMAKENPGYDSAAGDWHWQELDINQRVSQDGHLTTCSSCHAKPPCNDFLCSPP